MRELDKKINRYYLKPSEYNLSMKIDPTHPTRLKNTRNLDPLGLQRHVTLQRWLSRMKPNTLNGSPN